MWFKYLCTFFSLFSPSFFLSFPSFLPSFPVVQLSHLSSLQEEEQETKKTEANGNVETGVAKAVTNGEKAEGDEKKAERNGAAGGTSRGIDNPGLEVEETM